MVIPSLPTCSRAVGEPRWVRSQRTQVIQERLRRGRTSRTLAARLDARLTVGRHCVLVKHEDIEREVSATPGWVLYEKNQPNLAIKLSELD